MGRVLENDKNMNKQWRKSSEFLLSLNIIYRKFGI